MFLGHFAVGFGAKAVKPGVSLGVLFFSAQFLDLLWPTLLLLDLEHVTISPGNTVVTPLDFYDYPITHSFLMALVWGAMVGLVYGLIKKNRGDAILVGALVPSHWLLDFFVHRPDLPLLPDGGIKVGMGIWNSMPITLALEGVIFITGVWLYLRTTRSADRVGSIGFWSLIVFLLVIYVSNVTGPPPPDVSLIAWAGHLQWLIVLWAWWVDRHRVKVNV